MVSSFHLTRIRQASSDAPEATSDLLPLVARTCAWSPDGQRLAILSESLDPDHVRRCDVQIWNVDENRLEERINESLNVHSDCPPSIAWDDSGRWLAWHGGLPYVRLQDRSAGEWTTLIETDEIGPIAFGPGPEVWASFFVNKAEPGLAHARHHTGAWTVPGGRRTKIFSNWECDQRTGLAGTTAMATGGTRAALAGEDGSLRLLDLADARLVFEGRDSSVFLSCVAINSGNTLAACGDGNGQVLLHSLPEGRLIGKVAAHRGWATAVAFLNDNELLSAGEDRRICLWAIDGSGLRRLARWQTRSVPRELRRAPSGQKLAVIFARESAATLWDFATIRRELASYNVPW